MAKTSRIMALLVMALFVANVAYAAGSKLYFSDVDVKVGGKTSSNLNNGETIDDEAEPGDNIEVRAEVKNNFTNAENLEIEDVVIELTVEEIDDGDDFEDESSEFNLDAGDDKRVTFKFEVPLEVDEDTFDIELRAEGEDENGTDHSAVMRLKLDVEKDNHLIYISGASLNPAEVTCSRKNVQARATLINIGNDDEEDVVLQITNSDLGVNIREDVGNLDAEPNEDESRFSNTYSFNVPADTESGSYPILLRTLYNDNREKTEQTLTLTVNDCQTSAAPSSTKTSTQNAAEGEVELIIPTSGSSTTTVIQPTVPTGAVVTQESFLKSNAFVVGIIIAEIVAVLVGIVLIVSLFRRRG